MPRLNNSSQIEALRRQQEEIAAKLKKATASRKGQAQNRRTTPIRTSRASRPRPTQRPERRRGCESVLCGIGCLHKASCRSGAIPHALRQKDAPYLPGRAASPLMLGAVAYGHPGLNK